MNSHEARKLFDALSPGGQQAVESGIFTEYLLWLDPETLAEQIADEIGSATIDLQESLRAAFAAYQVAEVGVAVMRSCRALRTSHLKQFEELIKWRLWDAEDKQNRAHGLTEKGAIDER